MAESTVRACFADTEIFSVLKLDVNNDRYIPAGNFSFGLPRLFLVGINPRRPALISRRNKFAFPERKLPLRRLIFRKIWHSRSSSMTGRKKTIISCAMPTSRSRERGPMLRFLFGKSKLSSHLFSSANPFLFFALSL